MTITEFDQLEETNDVTYELIDGVVMMTPRPNFKHQSTQTNLIVELGAHFKGKQCSVMGETEIQLGEDVLVPDIFIYCDKDKFTQQRHMGAPTVTIEILSPGTEHHDLFRKLNCYAQHGVKEYWIVNPKTETITIHLLHFYAKIKSHLFGDFIFLVEARGVEPLSENLLPSASPSAVNVLTFPPRPSH